jgi:GNAT superfamily N-acetyltransferase
MRHLPEQPALDQLRHQARELQRAAARGDPDALQRLHAVSPRLTLAAAQLALAREYGLPSWARLKAEVERRRQLQAPGGRPPRYLLRPVRSVAELAEVFDLIAAQITPSVTHTDRRFLDLARRFPEDRALMLVAEHNGRIVGGALAFRNGGERGPSVTLRILGLEPGARGHGLGRRLMQALELQASSLGAPAITLGGASGDIKGFYVRLGYAGRGTMLSKALPLPGRFLEARLGRLQGTAGDLIVSRDTRIDDRAAPRAERGRPGSP